MAPILADPLGAPARPTPPDPVIYRVEPQHRTSGGVVARDPDTIQREIESARTALAESLDELSDRANPKHLVETGKQNVQARLNDPRIRYALIGVGALVGLLVIRRLFR
jgi:hypothetical protein